AGPCPGSARRRAGAERAAHLRQRRDQEGAVPRGQGRPQLACQDQAVVGPRLSLSHPHGVPARQQRMQGPAAAVGRRRLQACRTRLLVQGFDHPPQAAEGAAEAGPRDHAGATAGRLPPGAGRAGRETIADEDGLSAAPIWPTPAEWGILRQPMSERQSGNAHMHLRTATMAALLAGFQCFAGCNASAGETEAQASAETPWPTKSWQVSTPEEQGMDSASLARLIETVGTYKQDSLMIIRHGRIVAEAYYAPYAAGISHDLRSITKSIVSTLTAIEVKNGLLDSVDHPILDLFPDKNISNVDENKKAMTVQTL